MTRFPTTPRSTAPAGSSRRTVKTSIEPRPMYPTAFTQQQGNLATALATPARGDIFGGMAPTGFSLGSPAYQQAAGLNWANQMAQAQMLRPQIAQQHQFANLAQMLQAQAAREQEAQQWAGLGLQQQGIADQLSRIQQQGLLGMLLGRQPWWT